jgi:hypothetical protein
VKYCAETGSPSSHDGFNKPKKIFAAGPSPWPAKELKKQNKEFLPFFKVQSQQRLTNELRLEGTLCTYA